MAVADFSYATEDLKRVSFPVSSSILYVSEKGKTDDDFAKKLETDMITKALSRLGFNADVFMGKFDDNKYVAKMKEKFNKPEYIDEKRIAELNALIDLAQADEKKFLGYFNVTELKMLPANQYTKAMAGLKKKMKPAEESK